MYNKAMTLKDRFLSHVIPEPNSGCWLWDGSTNERYGQFLFYGRLWKAHRVSYLIYTGPIPDSMCVCHKCDIPICVNPEHLFLGTIKDNVADMIKKGRRMSSVGEDNNNAKLTETDVLGIYTSTLSSPKLAPKYNVHCSTIKRIKSGVTWRYLTENEQRE